MQRPSSASDNLEYHTRTQLRDGHHTQNQATENIPSAVCTVQHILSTTQPHGHSTLTWHAAVGVVAPAKRKAWERAKAVPASRPGDRPGFSSVVNQLLLSADRNSHDGVLL